VNPVTSTGCTSVDIGVNANLELVEKDCQAHKLNREDAKDHNRWRKQIRDD